MCIGGWHNSLGFCWNKKNIFSKVTFFRLDYLILSLFIEISFAKKLSCWNQMNQFIQSLWIMKPNTFLFFLIVKDCWSEGDSCDLTNSSVAFCLVCGYILEFTVSNLLKLLGKLIIISVRKVHWGLTVPLCWRIWHHFFLIYLYLYTVIAMWYLTGVGMLLFCFNYCYYSVNW